MQLQDLASERTFQSVHLVSTVLPRLVMIPKLSLKLETEPYNRHQALPRRRPQSVVAPASAVKHRTCATARARRSTRGGGGARGAGRGALLTRTRTGGARQQARSQSGAVAGASEAKFLY